MGCVLHEWCKRADGCACLVHRYDKDSKYDDKKQYDKYGYDTEYSSGEDYSSGEYSSGDYEGGPTCANIWLIDAPVQFTYMHDDKSVVYKGKLFAIMEWEKLDSCHKEGLPVFDGYEVKLDLEKVPESYDSYSGSGYDSGYDSGY